MRSLRVLPITVLALSSAACGGGDPPPPPVAPGRRAEAVQETDRLYRDDRTEIDSVRVVIADPETLRLWWLRATAQTPDPKPALPAVDFDRHTVLLVAAGRRNAGDRIRVDSVGFEIRPEPGGGRSEVWFAVVRTIPDCNPFPGIAYPVEVVRIPKVDSRLEFVDRLVTCPGGPAAAPTSGSRELSSRPTGRSPTAAGRPGTSPPRLR
jgi:hypothetical protein